MTPARFPHSDTPGSTLGCQLPRAYRRLLRPSSALDAKASTMCPSQLVTHTTNPTHPPHNMRDGTRQAMHTNHKAPPTGPGTINPEPATNNKQQPPPTKQRERVEDARVHDPDLKQQPHTHHPPPHRGPGDRPGKTAGTEAPDTAPRQLTTDNRQPSLIQRQLAAASR